jgi:hypothetical protein
VGTQSNSPECHNTQLRVSYFISFLHTGSTQVCDERLSQNFSGFKWGANISSPQEFAIIEREG